MPWFESSKDKQFRELVQGKMQICLAKPDKYAQAFPVLDSLVCKPNQKAIEMIVDHIKQVIKDEDYPPMQKLQAIYLLRDLMQSKNKALGKYVVVKILKRLAILAQHRKNQKDENRGANIFKCKKSQQKYGVQFLKTLLLCLSDWGKNWPRHADGPFHDFQSAYNDLLMQKQVAFPPDQKKTSKSPAPGGMRAGNVKDEYASPPKIAQQKNKIQNPISKPTIKQRKPASGPFLQYVNSMIDILNLLSTTLVENPQFGQIWGIIKAFVDQIKTIDEQGNLIVAQMIQNGEKNAEFVQTIQNNSTFIKQLTKDTRIVDKQSQNYAKYNGKYIKNCKRLILSLSIYTNKPSGSSIPNNGSSAQNNLKPQAQTSLNQKVQEIKAEKPKAQPERNRYGSSYQLKNQLQLNLQPIKKQDFNSGTLTNKQNQKNQNSQGSNRYNSVSPNPNDKNRQSLTQFNVIKQKQKNEIPQNQTKKQLKQTKQSKDSKQILGMLFGKPMAEQNKKQNVKQISKITQKNEGDSENNFNKFDFENDPPKQQKKNINSSFSDFQVAVGKSKKQNEDQHSNSNFFKEIQMGEDGKMQANTRRNRKLPNKKQQQQNINFFDISLKSKNQSQNLSGFDKSNLDKSSKQQKSKSKQISQQTKGKLGVEDDNHARAFDTFKSPNELIKAMEELKLSGNQSQHSRKSQNSNPFHTKMSKQENLFEDKPQNPFQTQFDPFSQKNRLSKQSKYVDENNQDNKSKSSNPFSSKNDISNRSQQKNSVKSKPPLPTKKSFVSNPFDTKSRHSQVEQRNQNQFEKNNNKDVQNPFQISQYTDPFQETNKKLPSQKQLSQRNSFLNIDVKKANSIKNPSNIMIDDPFTQIPKNSTVFNNKPAKLKTQQIPRNSVQKNQKSFQGFNFQDFMNASDRKSESHSVKNKQNQLQKSGFNMSDFGAVQNQQKNSNNNSFQTNNFFDKPIEPKNSLQQGKKSSKQSSFDFFNTNNNKKQEKPSKDFFEKSKSSIKQPVPQKLNNNKQVARKGTFDGFQFGFDDFPNISSQSNQQKDSVKNPFSQFQLSKGNLTNKKLSIQSKKNESKQSKQQVSWSKFQKQSLSASDQWNKFNNIVQKHSSQQKSQKQQQSQINQSQHQKSQKKIEKQDLNYNNNVQWFDQKIKSEQKKKQVTYSQKNSPIPNLENQQKQPYFGNSQKSISLQFQQPSPFQKKQISWQFTTVSAPSSTRYNITPDNLAAKKQQFIALSNQNQSKLQKYKYLNEQLNNLKRAYAEYLDRIGKTKEQRQQFTIILKRISQSNQMKEKQIEQLIKKIKKAEELKRKILENERILYQKSKNQNRIKQRQLQTKGRIVNKWQRFNNNLQRQRDIIKMEKTTSNFSYYV